MKSYGGLCYLLALAQLLQSLYRIQASATEVVQNEPGRNNSQPETRKETIITECDVVIVGGGPTGLATALTLSQPPHNCKCVLLEANPDFTSAYDPSKAYMYLVNGRGQELTNKFPLLQQKLTERGVIATSFITVPGDPEKPLPKEAYGTEDSNDEDNVIDGNSKKAKKQKWKLPSFVPSMKSAATNSADKGLPSNYWIQRHELAEIMKEVIDETSYSGDIASESPTGSVDVLMGHEFLNARPGPVNATGNQQEKINVEIRDSSTQHAYTIQCQLVVGADGYRSKVRECLARELTTGDRGDTSTFASSDKWPNLPSGKFKIKAWQSAAAGLRLKTLQFPLGFGMPDVNNTCIKTKGSLSYRVMSIYSGPTNYIAMGVLPMQDDSRYNTRLANMVTRPTHDIWKISEGTDMKMWFSKAFPRFKFDSDAGRELISDEEWERFAKAEGTRFPNCQYANGVSYSSRDGHNSAVLLGDALHSYPPDIGQGVNSGLADVVALDKFLKNAKLGSKDATSKIPLGEAMTKFEKERLPETKALIRLARFGSPYQYNQPHLLDKICKKLWLINILIRAVLSKITFGLVAEPAILSAFLNPGVSFRRIMIHADITTLVLWGTSFWIGKGLLWKVLGRH